VRELSIFGPRPDQPEVRDLLFATHYNLGLELARAGRLDEAQRALDAALAVQPDDPRALGQRRLATLYASGTERLRSGDWAEASAFFQQVYDIDQEYLEVRQVLTSSRLGWARQLQASEQREEALVQYQKLLALEPEHLEASLALATHPAAQEPVLLSAPLPVSPAAPRPQPRAATPTPQPIARQDRQARQQNPPSIGFNLSLPGFSVCSGGACPSPRPTSTPDSLSGLQRERAGERR
jgi:tetratricopeptide (TPR) repeat protein